MRVKKFLVIFVFVFVFLSNVSGVEAATLFTLPSSKELKIGEVFDLELRIDSNGQAFNAAQAVLGFPKDVLEVRAINFSSTASVFNFWLEEPNFGNSDGRVSFIGGTTSGVTGASSPILKITFAAKGLGEAAITLTGAAVTAADGSGTNILSGVREALFVVKPKVEAPLPPPPAPADLPTAPPPSEPPVTPPVPKPETPAAPLKVTPPGSD